MPSNPGRVAVILLAAAVTAVTVPSAAEASTLTVDTRPGFRAGLRVVAVAPMGCIRGLDCEEIERRVEEALRERSGLEVVPAAETREEMDEWGIRELTPGNLAAVAQDLGADAILTIDLLPAGGSGDGFNPRWSPLNPRGMSFSKSLTGGKKDGAQIHLVSGETGQPVLEGTVVGEKITGSTRRAVKELLKLVAKAFAQ